MPRHSMDSGLHAFANALDCNVVGKEVRWLPVAAGEKTHLWFDLLNYFKADSVF